MTDSKKPTLLVIDGHSLAFRAFYALPVESFVTKDGQHTNAIHGFIAMLINLLANEKPTHLAVAFDISRFSFRSRDYPEYKATRAVTPPEFVGQVPLLEEALAAMNIVTVTKEDYEADDILATLARKGAEDGYRVLVVSGDRDTIQLVNDDVTLLYPNVRGVSELKRYDRDAVVERYGVEPHQYPDVAALVGETSDNLVGVDKVGEKTAVKWVTQYGTLDAIIEHSDEIKGVVGEKLREQKENALRNRRLNRLIDDVELPIEPAALERKPINEQAVRDVFARLQFRTLLDRLLKAVHSDGVTGGPTPGDSAEETLADAPPVRTLVDEELGHWLATVSRSNTSPVAMHLEFDADGLAGFGLSTDSESAFVPWAPGRQDYAALESWLSGTSPKWLCGAKPQLKALHDAGLSFDGLAFDTRIASWLLNPNTTPPDLAAQVYEVLGETLTPGDPNQLLPEAEAPGVATQAWYVHRVAHALEGGIDARTRRVFDTLELPLVQVLTRMELAGVAVDSHALSTVRSELSATAEKLAQACFAEIGHEVNLGSPKQLQQVLFEELGMPKTRSMKTGYSTDAAALADLQQKNPHPFLDLLLKHRDATKLKQIIETLERSIAADGRIHTRYEQTGTSTGRISSTDPNLQNIPIRTEVGHRIRAAFVCGEGYDTLLTADYSQIEMRIMAHLSGDSALITAFRDGEDLHRFVGARIFGVEPAEVTPAMRTKVKAMSYGLAYGLSAFGLSKQLRIETAEARQLMADYFTRFGAVRDYLRNVVEQARTDGYTETIFGRRRPFPELTSPNRVIRENAERAALNAPIQGSAADIMKQAMLGIAKEMRERELRSRMLLQVHDELIFEVTRGEWDELEAIVRNNMTTAVELDVPLDVQVGRGTNWDAAGH